MIELYIDKVVRQISIEKKDEVEKKLRKRIYKLLDGRTDQQAIDDVLEYLGDPAAVANEYEDTQYLIGPRIYKSYTKVLKIMVKVVLIITAASNTIATIVASLLSFNFKKIMLQLVGTLPTVLSIILYMTVFVTVFFVIVERYMKEDTKIIIDYISSFQFINLWNEIKRRFHQRENRGQFSRISSMVNVGIGIMLLTIVLFSSFFLKRGLFVQSVIDYTVFEDYQMMIIILLGAYTGFNLLKLTYKKWDTFFVILNFVLNSFAAYVFWQLYQANGLVSEKYLLSQKITVLGEKMVLADIWNDVLFAVLIFIVVFSVVNSLFGVYQMFAQNIRMKRKKERALEETATIEKLKELERTGVIEKVESVTEDFAEDVEDKIEQGNDTTIVEMIVTDDKLKTEDKLQAADKLKNTDV